MTGLFGWLGDGRPDSIAIAAGMGAALRTQAGERWAAVRVDDLVVGALDAAAAEEVAVWAEPAWSDDGQHAVWLAGEIFAGDDLPLPRPQDAPRLPARRALANRLAAHGPATLAEVDGEYHVVWWDRNRRVLQCLMDRFGALPLYWTATAAGCAFACGVRGVLMAPGIDAAPDTDALREAVTFGGFRLGDRTNVRGVRMLPGAGALKACGHNAAVSRYWDWGRVESRPAVSVDDAGRECHARWRTAIGRRLAGAARPGQTLSGGLDSRAILAEAAPRAPRWTAITYGVPGCEDATYAAKAAKAAGRVDWRLLPLYEGDWLSTRDAHIQSTDGLVQLGDLMHLECLPLQRALIDVHLSGYIGDAVAGQTFADVQRIDDAAVAMPYYETAIGLGWPAALDHLRSATADPAWLTSRFALFEHKLPQSTSRWSHAWRAWGLRVRRPFTDYAFFDWCQSLPADLRGPKRVYERWLRAAYPALFARIPNHKTGAPVLASRMQLAQARGGRAVRRSWIATARRLGLPHTPWSRAFHDDVGRWRQADVRQRIEHAVLAGDGTAMSLWPARDLAALVGAWFDRGEGPTQVIGALYVFERYQRDLPAHLRRARELAAGVNWSLPAASC